MAACDGMRQAVRSYLRQHVDRAEVAVLPMATPNCFRLLINTFIIRLNKEEREEVEYVVNYTRLSGSSIVVEFRP